MITTQRRARRLAIAPPLLAMLIALGACGASDKDGAAGADDAAGSTVPSSIDVDTIESDDSGEVASLGTVEPASDSADADDSDDGGSGDRPSEAEMQQAALDFAKCMREHGIDMPDPQFSAEGGGMSVQAIGGDSGPIDEDAMQAANEACQPLMEDVMGSFEPPDPEELEQMKADALEFSKCMREHGVDMPDPQFGDNGQMTVQMGGEVKEGETPPPIDTDEFNEAAEACGQKGGFFSVSATPAGGTETGIGLNVEGDG